MSKKLLSVLLILSMVFSLIPGVRAQAAMTPEKPAYITGEFEYRIMGETGNVRTAKGVLENNTDIYVKVEDAAAMAGFEVYHDGGQYTFFRSSEEIWSHLNLSMNEDGTCYKNQETVPYLDIEGQGRVYGLVHLLRYLRAQFMVDDTGKDPVAVICPAEAKDILSVWSMYGDELESIQLSQKDLFISQGAFGTTVQSSLAVVFDNGFDWRVIVPKWGSDAIVQDEYEEALLTLANEDASYLVDSDGSEFMKIVDKYHFALNDPWVSEIVGMTNVPQDLVELFDFVEEADGFGKKVFSSQLDLDAASLKTMDGISTAADVVSYTTETISAFYNYMDIAGRSQGWKESFLQGLRLLESTDKKQFDKGSRGSVKLMQAACSKLLEEYEDPIKAAEGAVVEQGVMFFSKLLVTTAFPVGALLGVLDTCLGMADVLFDQEIDVGKTTYMVDCLMDISTAAFTGLNSAISQALAEARNQGFVSQETLQNLRAWAILALRVTQRTYAYVYALEKQNDSGFESTERAAAFRQVMSNALALMAIVTETENYDGNLLPLNTYPLLCEEPRQVRDDLTENLWRTCLAGGDVVDDETGEPISGALIDIYRSDAPETIYQSVGADSLGHWETSLDNRYDYTFVFHAVDANQQKYSDNSEGTSVADMDARQNYLYYTTRMSKGLEELFYAYLRANVVPQIGTCDGASFTTQLENKDMASGGGTGLLSALVDDLDNDGALEMVTVTSSVKESTSDMLVSLVFGTGYPTMSIDLDLYELKDGEVYHADGPKNIGYMEHISYGTISISASQWEGITYFVGTSIMDDLTTYGPHATAIYHAEGEKLVFDYVGGGSWGQGLPSDSDNQTMGARGTDFTNTSIGAGYLGPLSSLTFDLEFVSGGPSNVKVAISDFTYLVEALNESYKTIQERAQAFLKTLDENEVVAKGVIEEKLKKEEEAKNSAAGQTISNALAFITSTSGLNLNMTEESVSEDGSYHVSYKTDSIARLHIVVNAAGEITSIETEARTYTQTEEWIALKDAILRLPQLGLSEDIINAYSGELSTQSAEESVGGYTLKVHNVDNFFIGLVKE